ncbi:MAG: hypothetical protein GF315_11485 [candidate division Zixibacteria bacterium]|nr:hypothetical protein [candidate division Zixibacteria bacterium]
MSAKQDRAPPWVGWVDVNIIAVPKLVSEQHHRLGGIHNLTHHFMGFKEGGLNDGSCCDVGGGTRRHEEEDCFDLLATTSAIVSGISIRLSPNLKTSLFALRIYSCIQNAYEVVNDSN